jgi:peptide deformylase
MSNVLEIVAYPSAALRTPTSDVPAAKLGEYVDLARDMGATMESANGIGLAAVQVNHIIRLAVVHRDVAGTAEHLALFNPRITWRSWRSSTDEEGCLSLPGVFGNVKRPSSVEVSYIAADGQPATLKARAMFARVLQHEIDHLDGVLFIDRATLIREGKELLEKWNQ